jgi:DNA-directed RNA polymerase beta' subunit
MPHRVVFKIANPEDILKLSVVEITSPRLVKPKARLPDENGVLSLFMGSLDRRVRCATCENDLLHCPGHFGHIVFAAPIYHFGFIKKIVKMLRRLCYWCARVVKPATAVQQSNVLERPPSRNSMNSCSSTNAATTLLSAKQCCSVCGNFFLN